MTELNWTELWLIRASIQFSSVTQSRPTLCDPMDCSPPGLPITSSRSLLKLLSIESVMPSNHFILCRPLLFLLSIFPSVRVFPMSLFFASDGENIGVSVLPMNIQDWFSLGLTVSVSLQSKGLSRVFSNTKVQKDQFFGAQLAQLQLSHPYMTTGKTIALTRRTSEKRESTVISNMPGNWPPCCLWELS